MTLSPEEKLSLSRYRLEKAKKLLEDARILLEQQRFESSINRSYYAALTAAKAVLILFGIDPKTHEGVKTMVGKKLIMDGYAPNEYAKWFRGLLAEREDADYADFVKIDRNDADEAYNHASAFVKKSDDIAEKIRKEIHAPEKPK